MATDQGNQIGTDERAARDGQAPTVQSAISNEMVRIYKEQFGRGPTKVRTDWAGPDNLVTVLENTFTPAEKNLQRMGEHQRLREMRLFFQYASTDAFISPIERITGRSVRAFISGIDAEADVATELFVLHPQS